MTPPGSPGSDVVVIGAGIVGACCAYFAARAGLSVTVVDRSSVGSGTTSRGEGNILVSDKGPGAELRLAQLSLRRWLEIGDDVGPANLELERKGGLVVAPTETDLAGLQRFADEQAAADVVVDHVTADDLHAYEPHLAATLAGGVAYPDDLQVQPVLAAATLLARARAHGARVCTGVEVTGLERRADGRVAAVCAGAERFPTDAVVNAAGTWGGDIGQLLGAPVPVLPRRGFVLVTEPLPRMVRRKVYTADYVSNVASDDAGLETSLVVEGTRAGTVLIGASRERVGYDTTLSVDIVRRLAAQAVAVFPVLADVSLLRVYQGFRPYCPDHLPVIGPDPRVDGLFHACGHEGAGVGLSAGTGALVSELITGATPSIDPQPFSPTRFAQVSA